MAAKQLTLIEPAQPDWKLDELTKLRGRRGIAAARAQLDAHRPTDTTTHDRNPAVTTQAKGA